MGFSMKEIDHNEKANYQTNCRSHIRIGDYF